MFSIIVESMLKLEFDFQTSNFKEKLKNKHHVHMMKIVKFLSLDLDLCTNNALKLNSFKLICWYQR